MRKNFKTPSAMGFFLDRRFAGFSLELAGFYSISLKQSFTETNA